MPVLHCLPGDAFVTNRMPLSGKVPVLNLLTGQKIRFFGSKGRIVAPIDVKLGRAELYHHAKFVKDRTTRAGCRCENVVFVFLFFFVFFVFFLIVTLRVRSAVRSRGASFEHALLCHL